MDYIVDHLEHELEKAVTEESGTKTLFFQRIVDETIKRCNAENIDPRSVFSTAAYSWYYGNIVNGMVYYIVAPYISKMKYYRELSDSQTCEALYVLYKLLLTYDIDTDFPDYYDEFPIVMVDTALQNYPNNKHIQLLKRILTQTKNLKLMQNFLIRRFNHRMRQQAARRTAAAMIITKRALEYVLNPDTPAGKRLLQKRSKQFYELATL